MRDRLAQLQAAAARYAEEEADAVDAAIGVEVPGGIANEVRINIDDEITPGTASSEQQQQQEVFMGDFFEHVKEIRLMIEAISQRVDELKRKQFEVLSQPQVDEKVKQELDQIMLEIKQDANKIRTKLKQMDKSLSEEEESKKALADFRIRKSQYNTMYRRLCDVLSDYNDAQTQFRERCKATIKRQLEYTGKVTTDEELEEMIETGNTAAFTQGIEMDVQQARQMLRDVTSRHEDIKKLENSIKELYDMFMDMAMLVESQGEMIDRIEFNVAQTAEYVEEGVKEMAVAIRMKRAIRKKKCICCTILISVIVIAIVIVVIVVITQVGIGGGGSGGGGDKPQSTSSTATQSLLRTFNISAWAAT